MESISSFLVRTRSAGDGVTWAGRGYCVAPAPVAASLLTPVRAKLSLPTGVPAGSSPWKKKHEVQARALPAASTTRFMGTPYQLATSRGR